MIDGVESITLLCGTAAGLGLVHTLLGPDHYLPFVAMARAGRWSMKKTVLVTLLCGAGHVLGSVILGLAGVALGLTLFQLETIESYRGELAGWMLIAFGVVYLTWGVWFALRRQPHTHLHAHADGTLHRHEHSHTGGHAHAHDSLNNRNDDRFATGRSPASAAMTPWVLFTIFVFGPCEVLIPLLMYPAATGHPWGVVAVTLSFAATTLLTMTAAVLALCYAGASVSDRSNLQRYGHALAGFVVLGCGVTIKLGL